MTDNLKDNIANTMIKLSRKKKVDKITGTDLANACHISRQAFYYYYPDLLGVVEWTIDRQNINILNQIHNLEQTMDGFDLFAKELVHHFSEISLIIQSRLRSQWEKAFTENMKELIHSITKIDQSDFKVDFIACGLTMYVIEQCDNKSFDEEHFIQNMKDLLCSIF